MDFAYSFIFYNHTILYCLYCSINLKAFHGTVECAQFSCNRDDYLQRVLNMADFYFQNTLCSSY